MPLFFERQYQRQPWLIAIILGVGALGWGSLIQQVVRDKPVGDNPMSDWGVVVLWLLTGVGLPVFFFWMHMDTSVEPGRILIRMRPISSREILADQIVRFSARTYRPVREFGGWGLRGFGSNRAYNISGDQGVQLQLVDGNRVLIGSQRSRKLEAAIAEMMRRSPSAGP